MEDADYNDLKASLEWGAKLELTDEQRKSLVALCGKIVGEHWVPGWRLVEEANRRRAAEEPIKALEKRVEALETALKSSRQEWVFRRGSGAKSGAK
jgi:hypothetical protein